MSQWLPTPRACVDACKAAMASVILLTAVSVYAAPTTSALDAPASDSASTTPVPAGQPATPTTTPANNTLLATQLQPSTQALSDANQELLSRNAQLQREVNDLQTQANVLVYESKGQLFLYGAFTVLISLLVGVFISWLVFVRRERW